MQKPKKPSDPSLKLPLFAPLCGDNSLICFVFGGQCLHFVLMSNRADAASHEQGSFVGGLSGPTFPLSGAHGAHIFQDDLAGDPTNNKVPNKRRGTV